MKILIAIIVINLLNAPVIAQFLQNESKDTSVVYTFVEKMTKFLEMGNKIMN